MNRTNTQNAAFAAAFKRMLAAGLAAASVFAAGCAEKTPTVVEFGVPSENGSSGYINNVIEEGGLTYIEISGYATPEPVVTPAPTPVPTEKPAEPERTHRPKETEKPSEKTDGEQKATSTPRASRAKSPYADSYSKVSIEYSGSSTPIRFETKTLSGSAVSQKIFSRNRLTMINVWTVT